MDFTLRSLIIALSEHVLPSNLVVDQHVPEENHAFWGIHRHLGGFFIFLEDQTIHETPVISVIFDAHMQYHAMDFNECTPFQFLASCILMGNARIMDDWLIGWFQS